MLANRILHQTATAGTGDYTLQPPTGPYQSFRSEFADNAQVYYAIYDGSNWEIGIGTLHYNTPNDTLTRTTIIESSQANAAVNWGAGSKTIICTIPAQKLPYIDGAGNLTWPSGSLSVTANGTFGGTVTATGAITAGGTITANGTGLSSVAGNLTVGAGAAQRILRLNGGNSGSATEGAAIYFQNAGVTSHGIGHEAALVGNAVYNFGLLLGSWRTSGDLYGGSYSGSGLSTAFSANWYIQLAGTAQLANLSVTSGAAPASGYGISKGNATETKISGNGGGLYVGAQYASLLGVDGADTIFYIHKTGTGAGTAQMQYVRNGILGMQQYFDGTSFIYLSQPTVAQYFYISSLNWSLGLDTGGRVLIGGAGAIAPYNNYGDLVLPKFNRVRALNTIKAWATYWWTGAVIQIEDSFNISAITRPSASRQQITMANAMTLNRYCVFGNLNNGGGSGAWSLNLDIATQVPTTTQFTVIGRSGGSSAVDGTWNDIQVVGR